MREKSALDHMRRERSSCRVPHAKTVPRPRRLCRALVNLAEPGGCRAKHRRARRLAPTRAPSHVALVLHGCAAARTGSGTGLKCSATLPLPRVAPVNVLHASQAEPPGERIGEIELASGDVRPAVDNLRQHVYPAEADVDPRAARKHG